MRWPPFRRIPEHLAQPLQSTAAPPTTRNYRLAERTQCATILYVGPATHIGDAWQALYRSVRDEGLTPTDEERELYLYWEGVESPNNIVQVQLGIK